MQARYFHKDAFKVLGIVVHRNSGEEPNLGPEWGNRWFPGPQQYVSQRSIAKGTEYGIFIDTKDGGGWDYVICQEVSRDYNEPLPEGMVLREFEADQYVAVTLDDDEGKPDDIGRLVHLFHSEWTPQPGYERRVGHPIIFMEVYYDYGQRVELWSSITMTKDREARDEDTILPV